MAATRTERVVSIKRAIKDVVILGLRDVFTNTYEEPAFQNMRVVHEYPKDAQEYPCIVVRFKGRRYPPAGVGHYEIFPDPNGIYRRWEHRRFEGGLEFECCSLSALERDKLSDALLEALSFGNLTAALSGLLVRAYGDVNDPFNPMSLLFQINLNTDNLEEEGDSADLAPWQSEDALIYTSTFSMETTGGFYNSLPTDPNGLQYITHGKVLPYMLGEDLPFSTEGDPGDWTYSFSYFDDAEVTGTAVIHSRSHGADYFDHGHIYSIARISSLDDTAHEKIDAATVFSQGVISAVVHAGFTDAGTVTGSGVVSSSDDYEQSAGFIIQTAVRPDDGTSSLLANLAWDAPTLAGSHLFIVLAVRHTFAFASYGVTLPAGFTLIGSPRINNVTGVTLFPMYRMAAPSRSGTESIVITQDNGTAVLEGDIRWSMQLIEVSSLICPNASPTLQTSVASVSAFKAGYDSGDPTGSGEVFVGSGAHQSDAFVFAFATTPDGDAVNDPKHLDAASAIVRPDGWEIIERLVALTGDTNSPAQTSAFQAVAGASTSDLRIYSGNGPISVSFDQAPAQAWARFA